MSNEDVPKGLRPQVVWLLAILLALTFFPLFFAISTYTRTAHQRLLQQQALEIAQLIKAATPPVGLIEAPSPQMSTLLSQRVAAIRTIEADGRTQDATRAATLIEGAPNAAAERANTAWSHYGIWVTLPYGDGGALAVLVTTPASAFDRLDALLLLYMFIIALALLAGAYFIVTYRIIRPLSAVSHAATRVASPARELALPAPRSREFWELNNSLKAMTTRLLDEETALRDKIREVEEATERLKVTQAQLVRSERMATVGQLAAGLAHEIGNPIAAIIGLQDLILEGDLPKEQETEFLRRMRKESERINRVLRELLQFARPRSAAASATLERVNVADAIEETLALVRPQPSFRHLTIKTDVPPKLPLAYATHEGLTQVLLNLLLNAAHACQPDGEVRVSAAVQAGMLELAVQDNGEGVPEALRETLFEPFVSGKDAGHGTGLGLSVCRSLVEQFGAEAQALGAGSRSGSIELDSSFTSGARLVVRLPLARDTDRE